MWLGIVTELANDVGERMPSLEDFTSLSLVSWAVLQEVCEGQRVHTEFARAFLESSQIGPFLPVEHNGVVEPELCDSGDCESGQFGRNVE